MHISCFTVLFVYLSGFFGEEREMKLQKRENREWWQTREEIKLDAQNQLAVNTISFISPLVCRECKHPTDLHFSLIRSDCFRKVHYFSFKSGWMRWKEPISGLSSFVFVPFFYCASPLFCPFLFACCFICFCASSHPRMKPGVWWDWE